MGKMRPRMSKIRDRLDQVRTKIFELRKIIGHDIEALQRVQTLDDYYIIYEIGRAHCDELISYTRLIRKGERFLDVVYRFEDVAQEKLEELKGAQIAGTTVEAFQSGEEYGYTEDMIRQDGTLGPFLK